MKFKSIFRITIASLTVCAALFVPDQYACRADTFPIQATDLDEFTPAAAYNYQNDEFLIVWQQKGESYVFDIYGRLIKSDGEYIGEAFPISSDGESYYPDVAYGPQDEYLVVWQSGSDIHGARLDHRGKKIKGANTGPDTTFLICDQEKSQYDPKVACNYVNDTYLVVWMDFRNTVQVPHNTYTSSSNYDVYGQRVNHDGTLLDYASTVNFPIANNPAKDEYYVDVAYHGSDTTPLNEWLVVFCRADTTYSSSIGRIWGARVKGIDGSLLNAWGEKVGPDVLGKGVGTAVEEYPWSANFPIGYDGVSFFDNLPFFQGSPHVVSNSGWPVIGIGKPNGGTPDSYPVPEFLVVWTDFRNPSWDIYSQRVAYFPELTAYEMGLKMTSDGSSHHSPDSLFTATLLDAAGNPPDPAWQWITWPNYAVTNNAFFQTDNGLTYNPIGGEYLVGWNDYRELEWDGSGWPYPAADIYVQRLYLNPSDSALIWVGDDGTWYADPAVNIPLVHTEADEGNAEYPALAHSVGTNRFLVAYELDAAANDSTCDIQGAWYDGLTTGVEETDRLNHPKSLVLKQNYPNPFNPATAIEFEIPTARRIVVTIFDVLGREIATLLDDDVASGMHRIFWNGTDGSGSRVGSGVYFCQVRAGEFTKTAKMILMQ